MIEETVKNYLEDMLNMPVYLEMPEEQTKEFILIEKTGSSEADFIYSATLAIQSYAGSLYDAAMLNERVKAAMEEIIILPTVMMSSLNSDYNFTDTTRKKYRYQAVFDLIY